MFNLCEDVYMFVMSSLLIPDDLQHPAVDSAHFQRVLKQLCSLDIEH